MHLLFDLDGTLTDSRLGILRSLHHTLAENGLPASTDEDLMQFIGPPILDSFRVLTRDHPDRFDATVASYRARYSSVGLLENEVYPGIPELLARLAAAGHTLHVATSKAEVYARPILGHFQLERFFTSIHGSGLDGTRADKTELIAWLMECQRVPRGEAVMIGDRRHDMTGAANNGIAAVGALWGYGSEAELTAAGATACIASPGELEAVLATLR